MRLEKRKMMFEWMKIQDLDENLVVFIEILKREIYEYNIGFTEKLLHVDSNNSASFRTA